MPGMTNAYIECHCRVINDNIRSCVVLNEWTLEPTRGNRTERTETDLFNHSRFARIISH
jgi:hypothetical protein